MSREASLVNADWAEKNLNTDGVVFVEVDEDTTAYDGGHIPGAVKIDWKQDLQDPVRRDFVNKQQFEKLLSERGIANDKSTLLPDTTLQPSLRHASPYPPLPRERALQL